VLAIILFFFNVQIYNVNEKWLKEEKGHIQKDITNLTDEEIQQIEKVIEKGEYRGIKSLLLSCKATLDTLINHTNELKKRTSKNPKAIKLFKVKKILTNKLEELSKTLEIKINSITDEDIITDGFPFFTETEQSLLSILHSLDEHDLKDIYLMLAIKGERLPTTKKDLKKDITILKNASR